MRSSAVSASARWARPREKLRAANRQRDLDHWRDDDVGQWQRARHEGTVAPDGQSPNNPDEQAGQDQEPTRQKWNLGAGSSGLAIATASCSSSPDHRAVSGLVDARRRDFGGEGIEETRLSPSPGEIPCRELVMDQVRRKRCDRWIDALFRLPRANSSGTMRLTYA